MDQLVEVHIEALNASNSSPGNFVVVLSETEGQRKLALTIGATEAQVIALVLEDIVPERPLTHDLLKNVIESLNARLEKVVIDHVLDTVFIARLVLAQRDSELNIDCRSSDALALALRFQCPILLNEHLFADYHMPEITGKLFTEKRGNLDQYSLEELEELLSKVLFKEDYESAEIIKKHIARKSNP
jgi:bifunctional DNase/RNase